MFKNRHAAGKELARALQEYQGRPDAVVIGLARGGVGVAACVAEELHLPLSALIVRKLGAPGNEELGIGAVTEKGEAILNPHLIALLGVSQEYIQREIERQKGKAKQRSDLYCKKHLRPVLKDKIAIVVDDGIATGASMRAAIQSVRAQDAREIVLAVPVASAESLRVLEKEVDRVICLSTPVVFSSVAQSYREFEQVSDEEVVQFLSHSL